MVRAMSEAVNDRAKLMMHRLIARQLRNQPELLERARERLGDETTRELLAANEWRQILTRGDAHQVATLLCERSERMYRLRLTSPFIGAVDLSDPDLRRRIHRICRRRLEKQSQT